MALSNLCFISNALLPRGDYGLKEDSTETRRSVQRLF